MFSKAISKKSHAVTEQTKNVDILCKAYQGLVFYVEWILAKSRHKKFQDLGTVLVHAHILRGVPATLKKIRTLYISHRVILKLVKNTVWPPWLALPLYLSPFIFQLNVFCSFFFSHNLFEGKQIDIETSENFEQLMLACADKALNNFEVLKDVPGVWDIFITKHLEVLLLFIYTVRKSIWVQRNLS